MTIDELRDELKRLGDQRRAAEQASERLMVVIPEARDAGVSVTEIAELAGLSRMGVYKLLKRAA